MNQFFDEISRTSDAEAIALNEKYGTHNYHPLPVNIVKAKGALAWDGSGKEYIDCVGSYSAVAQGHLNEEITEAVLRQLKKLTLTSRAVYTTELGVFLKHLCEYTGFDMASPMNTGTEAVETCLKLIRKWGYTVKGIPENQAEIIVAGENFHGRSITIVGFSSEPGYKAGFGPFTPGFKTVSFGDLAELRAAITPNTAGILLEPIQAEGGILMPPSGYLTGVRALCDEHNVLFAADEIQTGFCRTGKKFAWMHDNAKPNLMTLGKALGGGLYPVSAVVGSREIMSVFKPGDHGSTFGGNPLAAVVGLASLEYLERNKLDERAARLGSALKQRLVAIGHPAVEDVRGEGLLVGMEVREGFDTKKLSASFLENGILTKETRSRTFRFAPPLTVPEELIEKIVEKTASALNAVTPATV